MKADPLLGMAGGLAMGDALFCPNCGTRQEGLPKFCHECGTDLSAIVAKRMAAAQPAVPQDAAAPPGTEPTAPAFAPSPPAPAAPAPVAPPPWSVPAKQAQFQSPPPPPFGVQPGPAPSLRPGGQAPLRPGFATPRPTGITILAVLEVIGGAFALLGALALFVATNSIYYYYGDKGTLQLVGALLAISGVLAFVLAHGFWHLRPWAWMLGVGLSCLGIVSDVLNIATYGSSATGSALIGIAIYGIILYYLNLNSTRAVFGRPPTTLLQPQPGGQIPGAPAPGQYTPPPPMQSSPPPWGQSAAPGPQPPTPWANQPAPAPSQTPPPPWAAGQAGPAADRPSAPPPPEQPAG